MDWVGTLGGPLIVLPATISRRWRGANHFTQAAKDNQGVKSWFNSPEIDDYDRACAVKDHHGILKVGRGHGMVLQTEGEPVAFISNDEGGVIVQVSYSDLDENGVRALVQATPGDLWLPTGDKLRVSRGGLIIFDSVHAGDVLPTILGEGANLPWMRLRLACGSYQIESAIYQPGPGTLLILHRLKRDDTSRRLDAPTAE